MTLDDKIFWCPRCSKNEGSVLVEDIKQSIKDLKEELKPIGSEHTSPLNKRVRYKKILDIIDKIFRPKLVEGGKQNEKRNNRKSNIPKK